MYDERKFTADVQQVEFHDDAAGITTDDDGGAAFDWDDVERVRLDGCEIPAAFDTKEFYKLPATVARPIHQPYQMGDERVWLQKPQEELKKAAWSLDNAPWTHGHPSTTMVKRVEDVRGFWKNPRYLDGVDDLDADLHVPVGDDESKEYLEQTDDVSVGFYNEIARVDDYDGVVGGNDAPDDKIDGYQTNILFDHVASVERGRCPPEKGCGIDGGPSSFIRDTTITDKSDAKTDSMPQESTDAPSGIYTADGDWFAVSPSETDGDSPKYPVNSCSDVSDAWHLRGHGDYSIEQSTLETRLERVADAKDCPDPSNGDESSDSIALDDVDYEIMPTDDDAVDGCGCNDDSTETMEFNIDTEDLTAEAVLMKMADTHDGVEEHLDDLREKAGAAEEAADALDADCACDIDDAVSVLKEERDKYKAEYDDVVAEKKEAEAEEILERTDRFGESVDEILDHEKHESLDDLRNTKELVDDLVSTTSEKTANPGDDGANESTDSEYAGGGYALSPWDE